MYYHITIHFRNDAQKGVSTFHKVWVVEKKMKSSLRKNCPYSELFWSALSCIRTEYGQKVRMRENADQNNSRSGCFDIRATATEWVNGIQKIMFDKL